MTAAPTSQDEHSAPIPQLTLARFMEGGHFGAHVRTMRIVYCELHDVLEQLVRKHLADFIEPEVPDFGMQMPCLFVRDMPKLEATGAAHRAGIDLLGITPLHASSGCRDGFLMGFAAYEQQELEIAVKKLAVALRALDR